MKDILGDTEVSSKITKEIMKTFMCDFLISKTKQYHHSTEQLWIPFKTEMMGNSQ